MFYLTVLKNLKIASINISEYIYSNSEILILFLRIAREKKGRIVRKTRNCEKKPELQDKNSQLLLLILLIN